MKIVFKEGFCVEVAKIEFEPNGFLKVYAYELDETGEVNPVEIDHIED